MNHPAIRRAKPRLVVGAGVRDVTPQRPTFLYGYPHVERISTGVHDPLFASALYMRAADDAVLFVSVDTIWLSKRQAATCRARIAATTGLREANIVLTATHTHSGPATVSMLSNADDPTVAPPDPEYLELLFNGIVTAAVDAFQTAAPAEIAMVTARCAAIGGNRHDPAGPTIEEIPVVAARSASGDARWIGLMYVNRVHPTVLHEDSALVSADFPGMCRRYLQMNLLGSDCPVLSPIGAAGNQSPRFAARSNTMAEATRIGELLGAAIKTTLATATFSTDLVIHCDSVEVMLLARALPTVEESESRIQAARRRLQELKTSKAERGPVRTAECAVFGAEECRCLARTAADGRLKAAWQSCLPAEIQLIRLGQLSIVTWPGEVFVEFAMQIREQHPDVTIVTLANGELQGYLVTADAVERNCYEACNAIFASPESGQALVNASMHLLDRASNAWAAATKDAIADYCR